MKYLLEKLAYGSFDAEDLKMMKKVVMIMQQASLCGLGESAQNALCSAMKAFPELFAVNEEVK